MAEKSFTIGYKKIRIDKSVTNKFAALVDLKGSPLLILHIGKKEDVYGLKIQKEIDEIIGKIYERNENENNEKTHEVFIRLDWLDSLENITPFIDRVYEERE